MNSMKINLLTALFASLFLVVGAQAQKPSGGSQGQTSSPNGNSGANTNANSNNNRPDMDNLIHQGHAGSYYGGTVKLSGGALPWDPILINVVCNGDTRHTTVTDAKGNFIISPKPDDGPINSAASSSNAPNGDAQNKAVAQFVGCDVKAALTGFDSSSVTIAQRNLTDDPNIGTITLKPAENATSSAMSATTAAAPKDAAKAYEKARGEWAENKPDKAQKDLQKAVQIDPQFAEAWYQLGKIQEAQKSPDAGASFQKAVSADPKFTPPYEHLVSSQAQAEKWQDVLDSTNNELELNPAGSPRLFYYNAVANMKLGKTDAAEDSVKKAIAADPNHTEPNAEQLLAVILANKQDLPGALEHLRIAVKYLPPGPNADLVKKQIAQLESATQSPSK